MWSSIRFCKRLSNIVDRKYVLSLLNDENERSQKALVAGARRINFTTFMTSDKNSLSDGDKIRINRIASYMFRSLQSNFFFFSKFVATCLIAPSDHQNQYALRIFVIILQFPHCMIHHENFSTRALA